MIFVSRNFQYSIGNFQGTFMWAFHNLSAHRWPKKPLLKISTWILCSQLFDVRTAQTFELEPCDRTTRTFFPTSCPDPRALFDRAAVPFFFPSVKQLFFLPRTHYSLLSVSFARFANIKNGLSSLQHFCKIVRPSGKNGNWAWDTGSCAWDWLIFVLSPFPYSGRVCGIGPWLSTDYKFTMLTHSRRLYSQMPHLMNSMRNIVCCLYGMDAASFNTSDILRLNFWLRNNKIFLWEIINECDLSCPTLFFFYSRDLSLFASMYGRASNICIANSTLSGNQTWMHTAPKCQRFTIRKHAFDMRYT